MKLRFALILLMVVIPAFVGCGFLSASDDGSTGDVIYVNSFESSADMDKWYGNGSAEFKDDAPMDGGSRSLLISGGCDHPHSAFDFTAAIDDRLLLTVWGKDLAIGGSIELENLESKRSLRIGIKGEAWTRYQSTDTLHIRKGDRLRLSMGAGGFVASAMLVDLLQLRRVD